LTERVLRWDGCVNVRDLGGLPTEDGRRTRFRAFVRGDNVTLLSEAGWQALVEYGVRHVVDLRFEAERDADPPHNEAVDVVHVPVFDPAGVLEANQVVMGVVDPAEWRSRSYLFFLERSPANFARAVSAVVAPSDGTVLVHCAGGVDRTGLVCALLLRLAGVGIDVIAADYAESEASWAPSRRVWIAEAPDEEERRVRTLLSVMPARAMHDVMVAVEERHGSVREYLLAAGATDAELDRAVARLRG
jgi:protein-tyrosine phosphatase